MVAICTVPLTAVFIVISCYVDSPIALISCLGEKVETNNKQYFLFININLDWIKIISYQDAFFG